MLYTPITLLTQTAIAPALDDYLELGGAVNGSRKILATNLLSPIVNVKWFGALGDGVTDDWNAIQDAINSVSAHPGGVVCFPPGQFRFTQPLDYTNLAYPVLTVGAGKSTQLRADVTTVAIDCTGSCDVIFRDFQLVSVGTPIAGILFAPSTTNYCLRNKMDNVITEGGFSKAAVFNFCSEEFQMSHCYIRNQAAGATAYWDTGDNLGVGEGVTSPCTTITPAVSGSNTEKRFYANTFQVDGSGTTDCLWLRGTGNVSFDETFFVPALTATGPSRSVIYIDNSVLTVAHFSLTNFRSEVGRKANNFIRINGAVAAHLWNIHSGLVDLGTLSATIGNLIYASAARLTTTHWHNVTGAAAVGFALSDLQYCRIDTIYPITVTGTMDGCHLLCASTSTFAILGLTNSIYFYDTGQFFLGLTGTVTNDSAAVGKIGEYVENNLVSGSAIALTTGTAVDIITIALTAGDWDVTGQAFFIPANTTTVTYLQGGISLVSATIPSADLGTEGQFGVPYTSTGTWHGVQFPTARFSLAAPTTIYLVAKAGFAISTCSVFGYIRARRIR